MTSSRAEMPFLYDSRAKQGATVGHRCTIGLTTISLIIPVSAKQFRTVIATNFSIPGNSLKDIFDPL